MTAGGGTASSWTELAPRFSWRPSQGRLLEHAQRVRDRRWHLAAPPGSGKTLIGLELARGVAEPTLVLAPTAAIRDQWCASTAMFGADPASFTSVDPQHPAPLLALTYQRLAHPGAAADDLRLAARRLWVGELAVADGEDVAEARVTAVERHDPQQAEQALRRCVRRLRRALSGDEDLPLAAETLLGQRPAAQLQRLAAIGVRCLVLDECHHLQDWWALVVAALVERLSRDGDVAVIGLTATLPEPRSARAAQNYRRVLGAVDAELPTPALVAEGALAPWRDGVHITSPTAAEAALIADWTQRFAQELDDHLAGEAFITWAVGKVQDPALTARAAVHDARAGWDDFWDRDPLLAVALAGWWAQRRLSLPSGFTPPPTAAATLDLEGRLRLVDAWLHDPAAEVGPERRRSLRACAARYGVSITAAGVRWGRSVADLVCARSSSKAEAAGLILAEEAARRGARMRALVAVEYDRATTPVAAVKAAMGQDAGTVGRVLAALCGGEDVVVHGVMAVTGRGAWADAASADRIVGVLNLAQGGSGRWVSVQGCDIPGAVRLDGRGPGWDAARWLAAAEACLNAGAVRILVATRGLVGEGWDHPALNVLVDLSEGATRTSATQLRGRVIRLDPRDREKVASLWDVVVVHPDAAGDWRRLGDRHASWWGPDERGVLVTGISKLCPLADRTVPPDARLAARINADSAAVMRDVGATRAAWAAADPAGVMLPRLSVRPRRRWQVRTRPRAAHALAGAAAGSGACGVLAALAAVGTPQLWPLALVLAPVSAAIALLARGRIRGERETLLALAEGVQAGLVATGRDELAGAAITVDRLPSGGWSVGIDGDDLAATVYADAVEEVLGPLGTPRWMIVVGGHAWRVPAAVGATREAAEGFAAAIRARIPSARLVRAGTPDATLAVLAAHRPLDELGRSHRWHANPR